MIVIDDAFVRRTLKTLPGDLLESLGFNVVVFAALKACSQRDSGSQRMLLSDIHLPG